MRLFLLFVVVPAVELVLLVEIGQVIGTLPTLGLIIATGLAGSALARSQGLSVWRKFQARLAEGRMPGDEIVDGLIILVAGALLLTPGVLTDIVGIAGLIPFTRRLIRKPVVELFRRRIVVSTPNPPDRSVHTEWSSDRDRS
jgi:UPF0716 protein FxsA